MTMSFRKLSKCLTFLLCLILVIPRVLLADLISVYYEQKIDLDYRREVNSVSLPVESISACAMKCTEKAQCVSFFFNILEFLCQTEGRIRLSFDGRDAGPWQYYEMKTQNVAFNRTVWMSSEHAPPYHDPKYAMDGKVVLDRTGVQCSSTEGQSNPWIVVDLGAIYNVKHITLFNRIDSLGNRLYDVVVSLGETNAGFPVECGQFKGPGMNAEVIHIICANNARGRFVKTEIKGSSALTLCKIRILI